MAVEIPVHLPNLTSTMQEVAMCATLTVRRIQQCVYRSDGKEGYSGYSDVFTR